MTTSSVIGWGSYDKYEGPFFRGSIRYTAPTQPDFMDKVLAVLTVTEGGCYDAINMYDRCIVSVGLIQWCEGGQFSVSTMLGRCNELDTPTLQHQISKFPIQVEFKRNKQGLYRFFYKNIEVGTQELQRQLFLGSSTTGMKGTWTETTKQYAKEVAAWFANIWLSPFYRQVQAEYTKAKIPSFLLPESRRILFSSITPSDQLSWSGALRAAYYSFAGNLPAVANRSLQKAVQNKDWVAADETDKFRLALQSLTFAPGIAIYPQRYNNIAPVLHRLFGVDIPLTADALRAWKGVAPIENIPLTAAENQWASRQIKLSDDLYNGAPSGMDVIDELIKNS